MFAAARRVPARRNRRAVTLIEVLVSVAVIAILLALAVPSLFRTKKSSIQTRCAANMRSAALVISVYMNDHDGSFPYAGDVPRTDYFRPEGAAVDASLGGVFGLLAGTWSLLFEDEWLGSIWNPALCCPKQPQYDANAPSGTVPLDAASLLLPQYWLSSAVWLDAATLDRLDRPHGDARARGNAVHDVTFPSQKAVMFEHMAFCASQPDLAFWLSIGQTPFADSTVVFVDGSVKRRIRQDALPAVGSLPFERTLYGVRGRDVDR